MTAEMIQLAQPSKTVQELYAADLPCISALEHTILATLATAETGRDAASAMVAALPPDGASCSLVDSLRRTETLLWLSYYQLADVYDQIPTTRDAEVVQAQVLYEELYDFMEAFVALRDRLNTPPFCVPTQAEDIVPRMTRVVA